jgi:hypothetical protein
MANAAIFVGWGQTVRGREAKALQVFNEALAYYGKLQQEGKIESFEPVILQPHGGDLTGFILLRGERAALDAVALTPEFQTMTIRAGLIVDGVGVINASIGSELMEGIGRLQGAINELA